VAAVEAKGTTIDAVYTHDQIVLAFAEAIASGARDPHFVVIVHEAGVDIAAVVDGRGSFVRHVELGIEMAPQELSQRLVAEIQKTELVVRRRLRRRHSPAPWWSASCRHLIATRCMILPALQEPPFASPRCRSLPKPCPVATALVCARWQPPRAFARDASVRTDALQADPHHTRGRRGCDGPRGLRVGHLRPFHAAQRDRRPGIRDSRQCLVGCGGAIDPRPLS